MIVLGIKYVGHDTGAAIVVERDGRLEWFAIAEARLNRVKHSFHFPLLSIEYCLTAAGVDRLADVDVIAFGTERHQLRSERTQVGMGGYHRNLTPYYQMVERLHGLDFREHLLTEQSFRCTGRDVLFVDHMSAHAASAFFPSGLEQAAVLAVDGEGTSIHMGAGTEIECIDRVGYGGPLIRNRSRLDERFPEYPASPGHLYEAITLRMGLSHFDCGKTMALAAYTDPAGSRGRTLRPSPERYLDFLVLHRDTIDEFDSRRRASAQLRREKLFDGDKLSRFWVEVAADLQATFEDDMRYLARLALRKTDSRRLCLAGGSALSCVANRAIVDDCEPEAMFIQPASSDEGVAFGAALLAYHRRGGRVRGTLDHAYLGCPNDPTKLPALLDAHGFTHRPASAAQIAARLADGAVGGRCVGASEFGPRALGNRSILADPRRENMRDVVNRRIKGREPYRPFAPSVLREKAEIYFDISGDTPFMILAASVRPEWRQRLPAVAHVDGSSRPQTVRREQNPGYYDLIEAFGALTGVHVLLNTSFNFRDEPIVESYDDALLSFLKTDLDFLVIEDRLIERHGEPAATRARLDTVIRERIDQSYRRLREQYLDLGRWDEVDRILSADWRATLPENFFNRASAFLY